MTNKHIGYNLSSHEFGAVNPSLEIRAIIRDQVEEMKENSIPLKEKTNSYFRNQSTIREYQ